MAVEDDQTSVDGGEAGAQPESAEPETQPESDYDPEAEMAFDGGGHVGPVEAAYEPWETVGSEDGSPPLPPPKPPPPPPQSPQTPLPAPGDDNPQGPPMFMFDDLPVPPVPPVPLVILDLEDMPDSQPVDPYRMGIPRWRQGGFSAGDGDGRARANSPPPPHPPPPPGPPPRPAFSMTPTPLRVRSSGSGSDLTPPFPPLPLAPVGGTTLSTGRGPVGPGSRRTIPIRGSRSLSIRQPEYCDCDFCTGKIGRERDVYPSWARLEGVGVGVEDDDDDSASDSDKNAPFSKRRRRENLQEVLKHKYSMPREMYNRLHAEYSESLTDMDPLAEKEMRNYRRHDRNDDFDAACAMQTSIISGAGDVAGSVGEGGHVGGRAFEVWEGGAEAEAAADQTEAVVEDDGLLKLLQQDPAQEHSQHEQDQEHTAETATPGHNNQSSPASGSRSRGSRLRRRRGHRLWEGSLRSGSATESAESESISEADSQLTQSSGIEKLNLDKAKHCLRDCVHELDLCNDEVGHLKAELLDLQERAQEMKEDLQECRVHARMWEEMVGF